MCMTRCRSDKCQRPSGSSASPAGAAAANCARAVAEAGGPCNSTALRSQGGSYRRTGAPGQSRLMRMTTEHEKTGGAWLSYLPLTADPTGFHYASSIRGPTTIRIVTQALSPPTSRCRLRYVPLLQRQSIPAVRTASRPHSTRRSNTGQVVVKACARLPPSTGSRTRRSGASCVSRRRPRSSVARSRRTAEGH